MTNQELLQIFVANTDYLHLQTNRNKNTPLFTPQNYHRMNFLKYYGLILLSEACKVFSLKCSAGSFLVKYHAECAKLQRIYFKIEDVYIGDSQNHKCQFKAGTNRKRINFGQCGTTTVSTENFIHVKNRVRNHYTDGFLVFAPKLDTGIECKIPRFIKVTSSVSVEG